MELALNIIMLLVLVISLLSVIYYIPRLFGWFYGFKQQKHIINNKQNKFAIIIPARDESKVIGCLFNSLKNQTYSQDNFDCHVLVKSENDKTIDMTNQFGGTIHIIKEKVCKGYDIDVALRKILKETPNKYDAYIIVDADCCLDQKFLEEMNNAMASGRQIIQAKRLVKNKLYHNKGANNWVSNCNGLIWTMIDELGNKYKSHKNVVNMTIGTGILLRADVVNQLGGWPYSKTLTEDIELMYDSVQKKFSTFYYNYAKIYVEESTSLKETNKRRSRWMIGVTDSKRLYKNTLNFLPYTKENQKNIYYANALSPVYYLIGTNFFSAIFFGMGTLLLTIFGNQLAGLSLAFCGVNFAIIYLSFLFLTIFCLLVDRKVNKMNFFERISTVLIHPFFYMWYIIIVIRAKTNLDKKEWKVIERMDLDEEISYGTDDKTRNIAAH